MDFNICECAILPITKKCNTSAFHYAIFGNALERDVDDHEYLWISISHDLCWKKCCNKITKKANKTLGLSFHTVFPSSKEVKSGAYQVLVRPQLEYTAEAWNSDNITAADRLEHIQCATARFVYHVYRRTPSVYNLINILGWDHLHTR